MGVPDSELQLRGQQEREVQSDLHLEEEKPPDSLQITKPNETRGIGPTTAIS